VKEGKDLFYKRILGKPIIIPNGVHKSYLLQKLKENKKYILQKEDYNALKLLKDLDEPLNKIQYYKEAKRVRVFTCLPENVAEEINIFRRSGTMSVIPTRTGFQHVKSKIFFFEELKKMEKNEYPVVVGHNENGTIVLPNGEKISFKSIEMACGENELNPIFISCYGAKYANISTSASNYALNVKEAINLSEILEINIKSGISKSQIDEIIMSFKQLMDCNRRKYYVKRVSIIAGSASAYYISKLKRNS